MPAKKSSQKIEIQPTTAPVVSIPVETTVPNETTYTIDQFIAESKVRKIDMIAGLRRGEIRIDFTNIGLKEAKDLVEVLNGTVTTYRQDNYRERELEQQVANYKAEYERISKKLDERKNELYKLEDQVATLKDDTRRAIKTIVGMW